MFDNLKIGDEILVRVSVHGFDSIWDIYKGELIHVQRSGDEHRLDIRIKGQIFSFYECQILGINEKNLEQFAI